MNIKLNEQRKNELRRKLVSLYLDIFDEEISDFKADLVLDAFMENLAPAIYNDALEDMKQFMLNQLEDLEAIHRKE